MTKRLVIFDLDGTLLDTIGDLSAACNHLLSQRGYPTHTDDQYRMMVGNGIDRLIERSLPPDVRSPETVQVLRPEFIDYYRAHIDQHTQPYAGIPELLEKLEVGGVKLAVASNKYHNGTVALVERFFPQRHFAAVLGQREGVPVKPDPAAVNEILALTGIRPADVLYVGDSGVDMQTARNAGIESAGVLWGFRHRAELVEAGARHIAASPADIILWVLP